MAAMVKLHGTGVVWPFIPQKGNPNILGIQSIPWWFDCTLQQSDIANGGCPLAMEAYRPIRLGCKGQWIVLRELLQETAILNVKNHGFL